MKPINIYSLTRLHAVQSLAMAERQLSGRKEKLNIKAWEIQSLRQLSEHLLQVDALTAEMDFFYSFQIPKLGKEFDLLRISEEQVINIELKSDYVDDARIKHQLEQNQYYLHALGKNIRSYTYVSNADRLLRLTRGGNLIEEKWTQLAEDLRKQGACCREDIERLFPEERYLISPLVEPERFLRGDYFLTSQQKDIKRNILKKLADRDSEEAVRFFGFTGLPRTGKSMLLYDLAMTLSERHKVLLLHCGNGNSSLAELNARLSRIDFVSGDAKADTEKESTGKSFVIKNLQDYSFLLIDEAHRMHSALLQYLAENSHVPMIIAYDYEKDIAVEEKPEDIAACIEALPGFVRYQLTNRIRMNQELSSFAHRLMHPVRGALHKKYPAVTVHYAGNIEELEIIKGSLRRDGYIYLYDSRLSLVEMQLQNAEAVDVNANVEDTVDKKVIAAAGDKAENRRGAKTENRNWPRDNILPADQDCNKSEGQEYDSLFMVLNRDFYFDRESYLRYDGEDPEKTVVRNVFYGLNRARSRVALIVFDNISLMERILYFLQG